VLQHIRQSYNTSGSATTHQAVLQHIRQCYNTSGSAATHQAVLQHIRQCYNTSGSAATHQAVLQHIRLQRTLAHTHHSIETVKHYLTSQLPKILMSDVGVYE